MDGKRARSCSRSEPVADKVVFERQRALGAALVLWPLACGGERAVRDPHGREIQHGAEVRGEARSARMVAASRVDEEDVRWPRKRADCSAEQLALAQRQQTRFVWRAGLARYDD